MELDTKHHNSGSNMLDNVPNKTITQQTEVNNMILESDDERNAFKYVCELASRATDRGCNDLDSTEHKMFGHIQCPQDGNNEPRNILYDFDILYWLKCQVKK